MQEFAMKFSPELIYYNMGCRNYFLPGCSEK